MTYGFTVSSLDPVFADTPEKLLTAEEEAALAFWIEAGTIAEDKLTRDDALTPAQRDELAELVHVGRLAIRRMIAANTGLVRLFCTGRPFSPLNYDDRYIEGMHGLERAVRKFDFTRGLKFSTYAATWIKNFVQRAEHQATPMPAALREQHHHITRTIDEFVASRGRQPSRGELAAAVGLSAARIDEIRRDYATAIRKVSLDESVGDDGRGHTRHNLVEAATDASGRVEAVDEALRATIDSLDMRHQQVLTEHFGLDNQPPRSVEEIAVARGLRPDRVRVVLEDALAALRTRLTPGAADMADHLIDVA